MPGSPETNTIPPSPLPSRSRAATPTDDSRSRPIIGAVTSDNAAGRSTPVAEGRECSHGIGLPLELKRRRDRSNRRVVRPAAAWPRRRAPCRAPPRFGAAPQCSTRRPSLRTSPCCPCPWLRGPPGPFRCRSGRRTPAGPLGRSVAGRRRAMSSAMRRPRIARSPSSSGHRSAEDAHGAITREVFHHAPERLDREDHESIAPSITSRASSDPSARPASRAHHIDGYRRHDPSLFPHQIAPVCHERCDMEQLVGD